MTDAEGGRVAHQQDGGVTRGQTGSPWARPAQEVLHDLGVDPETGLSAAEAATRLASVGPNVLRAAPPEPVWRKVLRQFQDPLVYLLLVAMAISLAAWWAQGASGWPIDVLVIALIVLANAVIGFVQENKAADAVAALGSMTATRSTVLRDGRLATVPSADLVPGDVLALSEGDAVGADARLVTATALRVQEASLTGESEATDKQPEVAPEQAGIEDRHGMVHKGTAVVSGVARAVVTSTAMATEVGRIATLLEETEQDPSPLEKEIAQISKMLGLLVIGIAVVVMAALVIINGVDSVDDLVTILLLGVSLAVAAVPEGLPAILSLVLAIGVQAMARRSAVMKDLHSVETLGSATVICSDKTGTLTRNEMTLRTVVTASGSVQLSGTGYGPEGHATVDGDEAVVLAEVQTVLAGGVVANNAQLTEDEDGWSVQGDPTEAAFLVAQAKVDGVASAVGDYRRTAEVPFSSERKMMSVLAHSGRGARITAKGAPDVLLGRCTSVQVGKSMEPLTEERRRAALDAVERLSAQGYRTLGVAWRPADQDRDPAVFDDAAETDLIYAGVVGILDPPREEAAAAIKEAHRAGVRTVMITGDHPVTAAAIAEEIGVVEDQHPPRSLTGRELEEIGPEGLPGATADVSVFARVAPEHKLRIVDALQAQGHVVAMTGDGVNDAPALKSADIGIAMGVTGTEVTKEAAKMILGDDNYATIIVAVRQGRVIFDNITKFLRYLLSSNMGEVLTVFLGVVLAGALGIADPAHPGATVVPLLATQILWINLVTDSGPALAMGVDPEIDDVMARRPRRPDDRILDRAMWARIVSVGLVMAVITLAVYDACLPGGLFSPLADRVPVEDQFAVARTTAFTTLVLLQLFNAFNARSATASAFHRLFSNRWLWAAIGLAALLQVLVVEVPFLQVAFGTASLDLVHWLVALAAASLVLVYEEVVKVVRRARA